MATRVSWRSRIALVLATLAVIFAAGFVAPAPPVRAAIPPLTIAQGIFKLFKGFGKRARTYEQLNRTKNEELAKLNQENAVAEQHWRTGALTFGDLVQEKARIIRTEQGVSDLTERLKKMTKDQFDRFLGQTVLNLALKRISSTNGFGKFTGDFNGFLTGADQSLTKAIGKITGVRGGILDDVIDIRTKIREADEVLALIGGPGGVAIRARLARIDRTLGRATSRFETLKDKIRGPLEEIQGELQKVGSDVQTKIGDIKDWRPTGFVLDTDAILNDPEAQRLAAEIKLLRGERDGKAILAGLARRAQARIQAILEAAGLDLGPEDRRAITVLAGRIFIDERLAGRKPGPGERDGMDTVAINTWMAVTGRPPVAVANFAGGRGGGGACSEAEPGFDSRWVVALQQDVTGLVTGIIRFHDCPGGGRVEYQVRGFASARDTIRLDAVKTLGRGELNDSTRNTVTFRLHREGAPSPLYAGCAGSVADSGGRCAPLQFSGS